MAFLSTAVGPRLYSAAMKMKPSSSATFFCHFWATSFCDGPQAGDTASSKNGSG